MTQHSSTQTCTKKHTSPSSTKLPTCGSASPSTQVPQAGPSIPLSSSLPTSHHQPSTPGPTDSAYESPRPITLPDAPARVVEAPLATQGQPPVPLPAPSDISALARTLAGLLTSEPLHTSDFSLKSLQGEEGL